MDLTCEQEFITRMQSDDKLPEDEEEMLVYVEFEGLVGSNVFNNEELQLDMIGIDTEHPIMQIDGRVCFYDLYST